MREICDKFTTLFILQSAVCSLQSATLNFILSKQHTHLRAMRIAIKSAALNNTPGETELEQLK